jgi:hypothetical protein
LTKGTAFTALPTIDKWKGSWKHYNSAFDGLLDAGTIKSVMFKGIEGGKRCVVEMFQDGDFQSDKNWKGTAEPKKGNVTQGRALKGESSRKLSMQ